MSSKRDKLEKQLRQKADDAIRKLLDNLPDPSNLTMTDMEECIGNMGHEIMQGTMQDVAQSEQVDPVQVMCETCQIEMYKRGKRRKRLVTKRGEIEVERQYYVCPQCGGGIFPP